MWLCELKLVLFLEKLLTTFWESFLLKAYHWKTILLIYCAFSSLRKEGKKGKYFFLPLLLKDMLENWIFGVFYRLIYVHWGICIIQRKDLSLMLMGIQHMCMSVYRTSICVHLVGMSSSK